ncbi:MAG TPA: hypothetical protein VG328_22935 [Stellaceae bacterium]|nr:hypothetical protein [Stellaceae bacterium]
MFAAMATLPICSSMSQSRLLDTLERAQKAVAAADRRIGQQRVIIAQYDRHGFDATVAHELLVNLLEMQAMRVASMDRLRAKLAF